MRLSRRGGAGRRPPAVPAWHDPSRQLTGREDRLLADLHALLGDDGLRAGHLGRATYRRDASFLNADPLAVALPRTVGQTAAVLRACRDYGVPFTPRAAGTGLAGVPRRRGREGCGPSSSASPGWTPCASSTWPTVAPGSSRGS